MKKALSLTALSALMKQSGSVDHKTFHTYKKLKTQTQSKKYAENKYLERAYKSWNVNPTSHRSVQALKKSLKNYPDTKNESSLSFWNAFRKQTGIYRKERNIKKIITGKNASSITQIKG